MKRYTAKCVVESEADKYHLNRVYSQVAEVQEKYPSKELEQTESYPHLKSLALAYGLRLNRAKEFKLARIILVNLYCRELI